MNVIMMRFIASLVLVIGQVGVKAQLLRPRALSLQKIATYTPLTDVVDQLRIDLDLQAINDYLNSASSKNQASSQKQASINNAQNVYKKGGFSQSLASLTLSSNGLPDALEKGDLVVGKSTADTDIVLLAKSDITSGTTSIQLQYQGGDCNVGGLPGSSENRGDQIWSGCLNATGSITVESSSRSVSYSYDIETENTNGRTIQGWSTSADSKMRVKPSEPFLPDFQKFYDYYGDSNYGDKIVMAAFSGTATAFTSGRGDLDFSSYDVEARSQAVKIGAGFMIPSMYLIREMEIGLAGCRTACQSDDCEEGKTSNNVNEVDEAVAFYTGSLEGSGYLPYAMANAWAALSGTAGPNGNSLSGTAKVNSDIYQQFMQMQTAFTTGDCDGAQKNKERVAQLIIVPMVQAVLRSARLQMRESKVTGTPSDFVVGATAAAAILPYVYACNPSDAEVLYDNLKTGRMDADGDEDTDVDFQAVKSALANNYACLGISCSDVGGVYDSTSNSFLSGAEPCGGSSTNQSEVIGLAVGIPIAVLAVLGAACLWCRCRQASSAPMSSSLPKSSVGSGAKASDATASEISHHDLDVGAPEFS